MNFIPLALRFILATVFILSGFPKLMSRPAFERAITKYRVLPAVFSRALSFLVPFVEVSAAAMLALGIATRVGAVILVVALIAFTAVIGVNLIRRRVIDCGCFGPAAPRKITWVSVTRNLALIAIAVEVAVRAPVALSIKPLSVDTTGALIRTPNALAMVPLGLLAVLMALVISEGVRLSKARKRLEHTGG
jgi:uncharacterized membrane protein YphA (DoxX/SURF4 family)